MADYKHVKRLGHGAFGKSFLCKKVADGTLVVIKEMSIDEDSTKLFENECKIHRSIIHPNVIEFYHSYVLSSKAFIVLEFMPGGTLASFLKNRDEKLTENEIISKFVQLLLALDFLHNREVIHCDISPANVLLSESHSVVKLADFGSAVQHDRNVNGIVGTPAYIAPEILENNRINKKCDIWSLGCLLYEMMTLKKAFDAVINPSITLDALFKSDFNCASSRDGYSKHFASLVFRMLDVDPLKRPSTSHLITSSFLMKHCIEVPLFLGVIKDSSQSTDGEPDELPKGCARVGEILVVDQNHSANFRRVLVEGKFPKLVQITCNSNYVYGLSETGALIIWKVNCNEKFESEWSLLDSPDVSFLVKVACGSSYVAALSDSGIIYTMGDGKCGCLGHGDFDDKLKLSVVQSLLYYDICDIACGPDHMIVVTSENELFVWGLNSCGCLGVNNHSIYNIPQRVKLHDDINIKSIYCAKENTLILTKDNLLFYAGSNRWKRKNSGEARNPVMETWEFVLSDYKVDGNISMASVGCDFLAVSSDKEDALDLSPAIHNMQRIYRNKILAFHINNYLLNITCYWNKSQSKTHIDEKLIVTLVNGCTNRDFSKRICISSELIYIIL